MLVLMLDLMAIEQSLKSVAMMLRDDSISETIVYNFFIFYYCISLKFMFQIFRRKVTTKT